MAMLPAQAPAEQGSVHEIRPRLTGGPFRGFADRSDERLVAIAKDGDERAFEVLYERHAAAILRYCRSLLRSAQEAEDVRQEVFVLAISALRRGAEPEAFRPWLYRVAHNACMSHLRARRPVLVADNGVLVGPAAAAEPVEGHREELRQLLDDIGRLPDVQRGALLLREMDGFSYEQVGEVLGLPPSTVRASIFRARRTLQGLAAARNASCEAIQSELGELADRRGRRRRHITSHLKVCAPCRDFRDGLRRRPAVLAGVAPGGALLALKGKLLGGAAGGGAALVGAGGGAGVAKIAAVAATSVALLAGAGVEAQRAIEHSRHAVPPAAGVRVADAGTGTGSSPGAGASAAVTSGPAARSAGSTAGGGALGGAVAPRPAIRSRARVRVRVNGGVNVAATVPAVAGPDAGQADGAVRSVPVAGAPLAVGALGGPGSAGSDEGSRAGDDRSGDRGGDGQNGGGDRGEIGPSGGGRRHGAGGRGGDEGDEGRAGGDGARGRAGDQADEGRAGGHGARGRGGDQADEAKPGLDRRHGARDQGDDGADGGGRPLTPERSGSGEAVADRGVASAPSPAAGAARPEQRSGARPADGQRPASGSTGSGTMPAPAAPPASPAVDPAPADDAGGGTSQPADPGAAEPAPAPDALPAPDPAPAVAPPAPADATPPGPDPAPSAATQSAVAQANR